MIQLSFRTRVIRRCDEKQVMLRHRGTFLRNSSDDAVFQTTDDPGDGGRLVFGHKRYIYSTHGRFLSFPRHSLQYQNETIVDLATYGFIWKYDGSFLGYVQCVFCGYIIEDFDEMKRAAMEHMTGNPDCPLLKLQASKNVPASMTRNTACIPQRQVFIPPDVASIVPNLNHPIVERTLINISPLGNIVLEEFGSLGDRKRLESFRTSTSFLITMPNDLVRYGFHWLGGESDVMKCGSCGLFVKNWQHGDLAAVVHSIFSPMCPFMKGLFFIKKNSYNETD